MLFAAFESTIAEYQFDFGQGVTVTNFMEQWTTKVGYPMISVVKINDLFVITQVSSRDRRKYSNRNDRDAEILFTGTIPYRYAR